MTELHIRPITPSIGAEIRGVDLSKPIDGPLRESIHQAMLDHQVVFFPEQSLSPAEHVAFGRLFGELQENHAPYVKVLEGHPQVVVIDNKPQSGGLGIDRSDVWHTDVTWQERPPIGSILYMEEIPESGGDTLWLNLTAAYEALSEPMRSFLDGLTAVHDLLHSATRLTDRFPVTREIIQGILEIPPVEHPLVRTHPITGRKGLFVNPTFTSHIAGIPRAESDPILAFLYQHYTQPEFFVRRHWRPGDLAFWDNRCTMHYAVRDYGTDPRCIHRVTLAGDEPR